MATLLGHLIDQLISSVSFSRCDEGRIFLIAPHPAFSRQDHLDALATLATEGFLHDFRYIDSMPNAAVLAIRR